MTVVVGVVSCNMLDVDGEALEEHAAVTAGKITTKPSPVMSGITFLRMYFICNCLPQSCQGALYLSFPFQSPN